MIKFVFLKRYKYSFTFIDIRFGRVGFWWIIDCDEWFVYFQFFKHLFRLSGAGNMHFVEE